MAKLYGFTLDMAQSASQFLNSTTDLSWVFWVEQEKQYKRNIRYYSSKVFSKSQGTQKEEHWRKQQGYTTTSSFEIYIDAFDPVVLQIVPFPTKFRQLTIPLLL